MQNKRLIKARYFFILCAFLILTIIVAGALFSPVVEIDFGNDLFLSFSESIYAHILKTSK